MDKRVIGIILLIFVVAVGFFVWQKSQVQMFPKKEESMVKKIDLTTQPDWVQKLVVTAKKGVSANGLENVTFSAKGFSDTVQSITYVIQYETTNKGTQGALSTKPLSLVDRAFTKTIDLGTCSTKSCARHEGVTSVDIELDITSASGDSYTWTGTISL